MSNHAVTKCSNRMLMDILLTYIVNLANGAAVQFEVLWQSKKPNSKEISR